MAIVDSLCEAKEMALEAVNPELFTIATLTGHVVMCYGPSYTVILRSILIYFVSVIFKALLHVCKGDNV